MALIGHETRHGPCNHMSHILHGIQDVPGCSKFLKSLDCDKGKKKKWLEEWRNSVLVTKRERVRLC